MNDGRGRFFCEKERGGLGGRVVRGKGRGGGGGESGGKIGEKGGGGGCKNVRTTVDWRGRLEREGGGGKWDRVWMVRNAYFTSSRFFFFLLSSSPDSSLTQPVPTQPNPTAIFHRGCSKEKRSSTSIDKYGVVWGMNMDEGCGPDGRGWEEC